VRRGVGSESEVERAQGGLPQIQESQGVGHGGPFLAHLSGHLLLLEPQLLNQQLVGPGLLHRIEIGPLEVFHEGKFHHLFIYGLFDEHGDALQPRLLRGPPAPLPRDDFVLPARWAHEDGLEEPVRLDGARQLL
jgi:hypothetical protein